MGMIGRAIRQRWGWAVPLAMVILGGGLIASDRVRAWRVGDRTWIARAPEQPPPEGSDVPLPTVRGEVVLPALDMRDVAVEFTEVGDLFSRFDPRSNIDVQLNWHEFGRAGIADERALARLPLAAGAKPLPRGATWTAGDVLYWLTASLGASTGGRTRFGWVAEQGRVIYISSVADLEAERRWRAQRSSGAGPALRGALDRPIGHAHFPDVALAEALEHCARLSGITVAYDCPRRRLAGRVVRHDRDSLVANDATVDHLLELILRRDASTGTALRLRAEQDRLVVFEEVVKP